MKKIPKRFTFYQIKFSEIDQITKDTLVDAIIFDLGHLNLKNLERGFSFNSKDKLDMSGLSKISFWRCSKSIKWKKVKSIIRILEEKDASRIAKNIIKSRLIKKITKVDQLVDMKIVKQKIYL